MESRFFRVQTPVAAAQQCRWIWQPNAIYNGNLIDCD